MDVQRPDLADARRRRRLIVAGILAVATAAAALGVARLKPASPEVERDGLFIDTVKRGPFVRQVRGTGVLVPEEVRWIPAQTDARVERIFVHPGSVVSADTVLVELSNAEVEQAARDAELQLGAGRAELQKREIELESAMLAQRANAAGIDADLTEARAQVEVDEELARNGVTSALTLKRSKARVEQLATRSEIERTRLDIARKAAAADLTMQRAHLDQLRAQYELRCKDAGALLVRAGIDGVLQQLPVEIGQRVASGTNVARVARPDTLKAELRIAETQARDVAIGQLVEIDTRNGLAHGHVSRIDPAVQNGTIGVDVTIDSDLPKGARPDLTVDGVIELERLENVLFVGRPVQGAEGATLGLFKLVNDGREAVQTAVSLGRTSVSSVEVRGGLREGDQVILSDMTPWSGHQRIRLE
jgi:HlyD family secretion protein